MNSQIAVVPIWAISKPTALSVAYALKTENSLIGIRLVDEQLTLVPSIRIRLMTRFLNSLIAFYCTLFIFSDHAFAQISESDIGSESGINESISRLTSTFEVKRAVIGLLIISALLVLLFFLYWYKTAQMAKANYIESLQPQIDFSHSTQNGKKKSKWITVKAEAKRNNKPFKKLRKP